MTILHINELEKKQDFNILPNKRTGGKKKREREKWKGEKEKEVLVVLGFLNEELCTWLDWKSYLLVMFFFFFWLGNGLRISLPGNFFLFLGS